MDEDFKNFLIGMGISEQEYLGLDPNSRIEWVKLFKAGKYLIPFIVYNNQFIINISCALDKEDSCQITHQGISLGMLVKSIYSLSRHCLLSCGDFIVAKIHQ